MPGPNIVGASVTGLTAVGYGQAGGSTTRYYWVQPIYNWGVGLMTSCVITNTLASLTFDNRIQLSWNPAPFAIGYNVYMTTTSTPPSYGAVMVAANITDNAYADRGRSNNLITSALINRGRLSLRGTYNFAVDTGAVSTIAIADSDIVPQGAILIDAYIFVPLACTSGGAATIAVGTSNGTNTNLLAATAVASFSLNSVIRGVPLTGPTPYRQPAAGQLTVTIATAALTAGQFDIEVGYFLPSRL